MAAFTHLNPEGSRFSDGTFGVYYCAQELDTALAEVRHHRRRLMRRTEEGPMQLQMRLYLADIDARLTDVRKVADCHRSDDYAPSQRWGLRYARPGAMACSIAACATQAELARRCFDPA